MLFNVLIWSYPFSSLDSSIHFSLPSIFFVGYILDISLQSICQKLDSKSTSVIAITSFTGLKAYILVAQCLIQLLEHRYSMAHTSRFVVTSSMLISHFSFTYSQAYDWLQQMRISSWYIIILRRTFAKTKVSTFFFIYFLT